MNKRLSSILCAAILSFGATFYGGLYAQETDDERLTRLTDNAEFYTLVKRSAPEYPRRAQRIGKEGYVVIEYTINPEGQVVDPKVIDADPAEYFEEAALAAIKKWKYRAEFNGVEPDLALARTRMRFALQ